VTLELALMPAAAQSAFMEDRDAPSLDAQSLGWAVISPKATRTVRLRRSPSKRPRWLPDVLRRLQQLSRSPFGWDGEGGTPLQPGALEASAVVLAEIMAEQSLPPQLVLTHEGGLQLEWHERGVDLEVEVRPSGEVEVLCTDRRSGEEWDGPLLLVLDRVRLLLSTRLFDASPLEG